MSRQNPTTTPSHQTIGLMKNFVKAMDRTSQAFRYLHETFSRLSKAKSKERVVEDPQFRELFKDGRFNNLHVQYTSVKRDRPWNSFRLVSTNIIENVRAENYKEIVEDMMMHSDAVSKDPLPSFPSGFLLRQLVSDEHGERFRT